MSSPPGEHGLPANHLLHLVDLTRRWNVPEGRLFSGLDLRREDLADPDLTVPLPTAVALIERARTLTREPALGLYLGFRMSISTHGFLGFAAMSAATLRDALELAIRYAPIRSTALALRLETAGTTAALVVEERAALAGARDFVLLGLLVGLWQIGNALLGREVRESTVHVTFAEPEYYARFRHVTPRIQFMEPANQLRFAASLLDTPLASADRASLRLARDQCERLLDSFGAPSRLVERARRLVLRSDAGVRTFDELAAAVHLSPRTLRRRLAGEGLSFSVLLEQARHDRALTLLRSPSRSTKEVAERLGYANVANFTRAFRRWTGQTPGAYRRRRESQ